MHLAKKAILLLPLIPAAVCLPLGTSAHSKSINVARSEGSGWALPIAPHIASRDVAVKDDGKEGGEVKADNPAAPSESKEDKKDKKGDKKYKKGDKEDKSGTAADKKQEKDKKKQAVDKKQKADDEKKHEADVEKTEKAEKKVKDAEGKKKKSKGSKGKKGKDSEGKENEAPEGKEEQKRAVLIDLPEDGIESEDGAMPDPKSGPVGHSLHMTIPVAPRALQEELQLQRRSLLNSGTEIPEAIRKLLPPKLAGLSAAELRKILLTKLDELEKTQGAAAGGSKTPKRGFMSWIKDVKNSIKNDLKQLPKVAMQWIKKIFKGKKSSTPDAAPAAVPAAGAGAAAGGEADTGAGAGAGAGAADASAGAGAGADAATPAKGAGAAADASAGAGAGADATAPAASTSGAKGAGAAAGAKGAGAAEAGADAAAPAASAGGAKGAKGAGAAAEAAE